MSGPRIRVEIGESAVFTRLFIDDKEIPGITRVWFDSGDLNHGDQPGRAWRTHTRVHVEMLPSELIVTGELEPEVYVAPVRPVVIP